MVKHPILDFQSGHDLTVSEIESHVELCADAWSLLGILSLSLSLSLSLPLLHQCTRTHALSLKINIFLIKENLMFIFERERQSVSGGGVGRRAGRERETQNPKQTPGSELPAQSLMRGSNPWTARS